MPLTYIKKQEVLDGLQNQTHVIIRTSYGYVQPESFEFVVKGQWKGFTIHPNTYRAVEPLLKSLGFKRGNGDTKYHVMVLKSE